MSWQHAIAISIVAIASNVSAAPPTAVPAPEPIAVPRPIPAATTQPTQKGLLQDGPSLADLEKSFAAQKSNGDKRATLAWQIVRLAIERGAAARADHANAKTGSERAKHAQLARAYHDKALQYGSVVETQHDDFGKYDDVLFDVTYELETFEPLDAKDAKSAADEKKKNRDRAVALYELLLKKRPKSRFAEWAHLAIGDALFDAGNHKLALDAYDRAIAVSDPKTSSAWGFAEYRRGLVHWHLKNEKQAAAAFARARDWGAKNPSLPKATEIEAAAKKALATLGS